MLLLCLLRYFQQKNTDKYTKIVIPDISACLGVFENYASATLNIFKPGLMVFVNASWQKQPFYSQHSLVPLWWQFNQAASIILKNGF